MESGKKKVKSPKALIKFAHCMPTCTDGVLSTMAADLSWKCQIREYLLLINTSHCVLIKTSHRQKLQHVLLFGENIQTSTRLAWLQLYRQEHFTDSAEIPERNSIWRDSCPKKTLFLEDKLFCHSKIKMCPFFLDPFQININPQSRESKLC